MTRKVHRRRGENGDDDMQYRELFEEHETMRHQVERLKHVALKRGIKPARALTATLVAVGMMATAAISFVLPPHQCQCGFRQARWQPLHASDH